MTTTNDFFPHKFVTLSLKGNGDNTTALSANDLNHAGGNETLSVSLLFTGILRSFVIKLLLFCFTQKAAKRV